MARICSTINKEDRMKDIHSNMMMTVGNFAVVSQKIYHSIRCCCC